MSGDFTGDFAMMRMHVAFLAEDVPDDVGDKIVLCLSPSATHFCIQNNILYQTDEDFFDDDDHARCVDFLVEQMCLFDQVKISVDPDIRLILKNQFFYMAGLYIRVHVLFEKIKDQTHESADDLVRRLLSKTTFGTPISSGSLFFYRWINRILWRWRVRKRKPSLKLFLFSAAKTIENFQEAIQDDFHAVSFYYGKKGIRFFCDFLKSFFHSLDKPWRLNVPVVMGQIKRSEKESLLYLVDQFMVVLQKSPVAEFIDRHVWVADAVFALAARRGLEDVCDVLLPDGVIHHDTSSRLAGPMVMAGRMMGAKSVSVNHNSFPQNDSALATKMFNLLTDLRVCPDLCDVVFSRDVLSQYFLSSRFSSQHILPMPMTDCVNQETLVPLVLHAGNSSTWTNFLPVIVETTHEFVSRVQDFVAGVAGIDNFRVEIRLRQKDELNFASLAGLIQAPAHVEITGPEVPFQHRLAVCDLLVAYYSTTVVDALRARKPVLLWGDLQRFSHFPAMTDFPTSERRAAVYGVENKDDLSAMIEAILQAHRGKPLTDVELEGILPLKAFVGLADIV